MTKTLFLSILYIFRCIDEETEKARKLEESDLGIRIEDFVRIGETYCWHLDSVDPFTG